MDKPKHKQHDFWTEIEHQKFLEALQKYGKNWKKISEYIGTKDKQKTYFHGLNTARKFKIDPTLKGAYLLEVLE